MIIEINLWMNMIAVVGRRFRIAKLDVVKNHHKIKMSGYKNTVRGLYMYESQSHEIVSALVSVNT